MTNAEKIMKRIQHEDAAFVRWVEIFLESEPELNLPLLRDLHKHNATPAEYRAHIKRIEGWKP